MVSSRTSARWSAVPAVVICLLPVFAVAPAAHAAFTTQTVASAVVATATIGSPTTVSVTPTCGSKKSFTLTVNVQEAVPYANFLAITITSGTESIDRVQSVGVSALHTLDVSAAKGNSVDFTYTVRGFYQPSGSPTVWRSAAPLTRMVTCS